MAVIDGLKLDRGEATQTALSAPAVVGLLDPDHDRQAQFLQAGPALPIQDVFLQQGEKGFHGGVDRARPDPAHGPCELVVGELVHEFPGSKWTAAVAVDHATGHRAAAGHRTAQGRDRQGCLHL